MDSVGIFNRRQKTPTKDCAADSSGDLVSVSDPDSDTVDFTIVSVTPNCCQWFASAAEQQAARE